MKNPIPNGYITIQNYIKKNPRGLRKLSYHGFTYYRTMGLLKDPIKFKGHTTKYYKESYLDKRLDYVRSQRYFMGVCLSSIPCE